MSPHELDLLAWTRNRGRLADIGRAFGASPTTLDVPGLRGRWLAPLRYALLVVLTLRWLLARRPRVVVVSCPPPFAAVLVALYARLSGRAFILDAHPGAFGGRDALWRRFVPLQRALVRRAKATMVTEPALADLVSAWGGTPLVFHEAPPALEPAARLRRPGPRPRVVFATIFDPDEPVQAIAAAACELAECDVAITGEAERLPHSARQKLLARSHVRLTGWLEQDEYLKLAAAADVVVALTLDPHSVMRSAFEAVYLERVTVISDTPTLRACFAPSVFTENAAGAIAQAVREAIGEHQRWSRSATARRQALMRRWTGQRAALEAAIAAAGTHADRIGRAAQAPAR